METSIMPDNCSEVKAVLKEFYDRNASDRDISEVQEWKTRPRCDFLKYILEEKKADLLEIGAGPGRDSKFFMENGLKVVAVDLSGEMVKLCKEKGIEAFEMDFFELSTLGMKFDCVWSMNSLLHVHRPHLPLVLSEIDKCIKSSGLFYMGVYGGEDLEGTFVDDVYNLPRYYSWLADETLKTIVSEQFNIISFDKIELDKTVFGQKLHFQSLVMRKKPL